VVLLFLSFLFLVSLLVVVVVLLLLLPLLLLVLSLFVAFELWRCRSLAVGSLTPSLPPYTIRHRMNGTHRQEQEQQQQ